MKRKLSMTLAIILVATSFVGCQVANIPSVGQNSGDYIVSIERVHTFVEKNDNGYYAETPIATSNGSSEKSHILLEIGDIVLEPNADIISELTQYNEVYKEPTDVRLTGEIKDNKMYFYYDGYVTTLDGVTEDYNKVIVCDIDFDMKNIDFELDDDPTMSFDEVRNAIDTVNE